MELTHIALFAGIGGDTLAAQWAGFRTILFVEIDKYCQKVLRKHWPYVPIIEDIRDTTKETLERFMANTRCGYKGECSLSYQEFIRGNSSQKSTGSASRPSTFSGKREIRREANTDNPITLITGGFPCQPVSVAGKRRGKDDVRWLWPEMLRVISEVRPTWVVAENITGLLHLGFYDVLSSLEGCGYETITFVIPACAINAPHRRDRVFIVAHDNTSGFNDERLEGQGIQRRQQARYEDRASCKDVANTQGNRIRQEFSSITDKLLSEDRASQEFESSSGYATNTKREGLEGAESEGSTLAWGCPTEYFRSNWWAVEPDVGRVAYGIPSRVDRLKGLGNALVPQLMYIILKAIADIERMK